MKNILILLFLLPTIASAQYSGGFGYFSLGNQQLKHTPINEVHRDNGFSSFNPSALHVGGGGFGAIKGFLIGGEGVVITSGNLSSNGFESSLAAAYGMLQVGYIPASTRFNRKSVVYPVLGIGRGGSAYRLKVQDPMPEIDIRANSDQLFMKLELNVALYPFTLKKSDTHAGALAALSVGYLYNPSSTSFKQSKDNTYAPQLGTAPTAYTAGWYIKLCIGGGGLGRK
jgi:hypothetical protein